MTRDEDERARRDAQHDLESWARKQPPPEPGQEPADPVTVVRVRLPEHDGADLYALARWSLAARLIRGAAAAGDRGQITGLGPLPLAVDRPDALVTIGVRRDGAWVSVTPGMEAIAAAAADMERGRN